MGFLESTVWRLFNSPPRDAFAPRSPKLLETPLRSSTSKFSLPNGDSSSSSSSASSLSSSSTFWQSPSPHSRWSPNRYIPSKYRSALSKSQIAVLVCVTLALLVWIIPPPAAWRHRVVHISVPPPATNPYQVLRPVSPSSIKKHAPDPVRWLEHNSNNRHAVSSGRRVLDGISQLGHPSKRPRAALISLVRNSELPGLMQSMRQLEYHWNHKYQYPWVFFNDEPFSEEFRVRSPPQ